MYRILGDQTLQDKGWNMFKSVVNYTTRTLATPPSTTWPDLKSGRSTLARAFGDRTSSVWMNTFSTPRHIRS
ncbi:hypothetical protein IWZ01DRAFT_540516 [Phyllosticta capitalensis]